MAVWHTSPATGTRRVITESALWCPRQPLLVAQGHHLLPWCLISCNPPTLATCRRVCPCCRRAASRPTLDPDRLTRRSFWQKATTSSWFSRSSTWPVGLPCGEQLGEGRNQKRPNRASCTIFLVFQGQHWTSGIARQCGAFWHILVARLIGQSMLSLRCTWTPHLPLSPLAAHRVNDHQRPHALARRPHAVQRRLRADRRTRGRGL